jgi:p21-activated kinase 1
VVASFSPLPADRKSAISHSHSGSVAAKGKRGILDFRTDLLSSNKQSEISLPNNVVHVTHVGRNSYTGELTGLPEEWQQLLQDSEISDSGSDQQKKSPLAVVEICTVYPELSKSVDDGFIPSVSVFPRASAAL